MVDSSCSPLTLVRRTRSGNLILCADPIRKKLSSVLGRQTHFPFWNTSSPTVTTLCYKQHHRFVFSVSSDEKILGRILGKGGDAPLKNDFNLASCFCCCCCFCVCRILFILESHRSSRGGGEGGCAPSAPLPRSTPVYDILLRSCWHAQLVNVHPMNGNSDTGIRWFLACQIRTCIFREGPKSSTR